MQRGTDFYLGLSVLGIIAASAAVYLLQPFQKLSPEVPKPAPFRLKASDLGGRLRVDWDPRNPAVQSAQAATLEVQDGGAFQRYPVTAQVLRNGGLDYVRKSGDVLLTLTLYENGQPGHQATVRRVEQVQAAPAPEPSVQQPTTSRSRNQSRGRRRR